MSKPRNSFFSACIRAFQQAALISAASLWGHVALAETQTSESTAAKAGSTQAGLYSDWNGDGYAAPSGLSPVFADAPDLEAPELARRSFELSGNWLVAHKLCPSGTAECDNAAGFAMHLSLLVRETPYFGWGLSAQLSKFKEALRADQFSAVLNNRGFAGLLIGRLSLLPAGTVEPFIQAGFGAGEFSSNGHISVSNSEQAVAAATHSPIYQASAGLDFHVTGSVSVGALFNWTHWLIADFERCQQVAFGVCGVPGPGRFDLENAVWSVGVSTSVAFGQRL